MTTPRYSRAAAEVHVSVEGTAVSRAPRVVFVGTDPAALHLRSVSGWLLESSRCDESVQSRSTMGFRNYAELDYSPLEANTKYIS